MKRIALFFGSFNPVHNGHIGIGLEVLKQQKADEVHYVLSPQNPHKPVTELLSEHHRWNMLQLALDPHPKMIPNDIELRLPTPSYTAVTLQKLVEKHSNSTFVLVVGADSAMHLDTWQNAAYIKQFPLLIYPRNDISLDAFPEEQRLHAPLFDISATAIRNTKDNATLKVWLPELVLHYVKQHKLFTDT